MAEPGLRWTRNGEWAGSLVFVIVVIVGYLSVLATGQDRFTVAELILFIALGLVYILVGTFGLALAERAGTLPAAASFLAVQLLLGAAIIYMGLGPGFIALILFPLASASVTLLPLKWAAVACGFILLAFAIPLRLHTNWLTALLGTSTFATGVLFVVLFTLLLLREQKQRLEVERLARELEEANRQLGNYATQVEELAITRERNRLAREIHDSLGHYLTVINVQIEAARAVLDSDRPRSLESLQKAQSLAQEGLSEVRRSVGALRQPPTEDRPLPQAIAALADENRASGIVTEVAVKGRPRQLPPPAELTLYRAVQEGLTNLRKHARASRVDLTLDYTAGETVQLTIRDNGVGADQIEGGFGLLGLQERVRHLGGQVRIETAPRQGFCLEVEVPG